MDHPDLFSATDAAGRRAGAQRRPRPLRGWVPTALALGLFAQICLAGLAPALREAERLDGVEAQLEARRGQLVAEAEELVRLRAARNDPVYRERLRRSGLDPEGGPAEAALRASDR